MESQSTSAGMISLVDRVCELPEVVAVLSDRQMVELGEWVELLTDPHHQAHFWSEIFTRLWLYADRCPQDLRELADFFSKRASTEWKQRFEAELLQLRHNDDGRELPDSGNLDAEEARVWGLLSARVRAFLEADGLIALIPKNLTDNGDGIVVPFRFVASANPSQFLDAKGKELTIPEWSNVLKQLGDYGPVQGNQSVQIEAVFSATTPPSGASLGLALAVAWARRQARYFPLFSPLELLATGEFTRGKVSAVRGTGGESDIEGGPKGDLAKRLGVKLYLAVDVAKDFTRESNCKVCSFTSGSAWVEVHSIAAEAVRQLKLLDAPRHLQRVVQEDIDTTSNNLRSPELWSRWRRLGRVRNANSSTIDQKGKAKIAQQETEITLGFSGVGIIAAVSDQVVSDYHKRTFVGRKSQINILNNFLANKPNGKTMIVLAPPGVGKSGLMAELVKNHIPSDRATLVHFFRQLDRGEMTRPASGFLRRLWHFLLSETGSGSDKGKNLEKFDDLVEQVDIALQKWSYSSTRRPLVIVIDGLDEAKDAFDPPWPSGLPDNVHVIVSCRTGEHFKLPSNWSAWLNNATIITLEELNESELVDWLNELFRDLSVEESGQLPDLKDLAKNIKKKTKGNALYTQYLLEDLHKAIKENVNWETIEQTINNTPEQFVNYLQRQYEELGNSKEANRARELMTFLLAANAPLNLADMRDVLQNMELGYDFSDIPWQAYRWFTREPGSREGLGVQFALAHEMLRDAFENVVDIKYAKELLRKRNIQLAIRDSTPFVLLRKPNSMVEAYITSDAVTSTASVPVLTKSPVLPPNRVVPLVNEVSALAATPVTPTSPELQADASDVTDESGVSVETHLPNPVPKLPDPAKRSAVSLSDLEALIENKDYIKALSIDAPGESAPLLVLDAVRRGLEHVIRNPTLDYNKVTDLALTHAKLLHQLTQQEKLSGENNRSALETAEYFLKLPVQWDPAAQVMWRLVAAWEHHRAKRTTEHNRLLKVLANTYDVRLPTAWKFLAGAILVEVVYPLDPLLATLARRFLNVEATAEMVGRLVHKGAAGFRAAEQWLENSSQHEASALRRHIVQSLAHAGRWNEAEEVTHAAATVKERAELFLRLAEIARDNLNQTERLRKWAVCLDQRMEKAKLANVDERRKQDKLANRDFLRVASALACIDSIRTRHLLLRQNPNARQLAKQAESTVRDERFKRGSSLIDVQLVLASAYGKAATNQTQKKAQDRLKSLARLHRRKAFRAWLDFRETRNAQTLEVFQAWLGIASLTFGFIRQGVLTDRIGRAWENRLRRILISTDESGDLRISALLNSREAMRQSDASHSRTSVSGLRFLEPVEWDIAMLSAVEAALEAPGFAHEDVMQVVRRSRNPEGRARGMARWVKRLVETGQTGVAESTLAKADLHAEDVAAAYSLLARRLLNKGNTNAAVCYSVKSIQTGTETFRGEHSAQQVELMAALSRAAEGQGRRLFDEASDLVTEYPNSRPVEKTFLCLSLSSTAIYHRRRNPQKDSDRIQWTAKANHWFNEISKLQKRPGTAYQLRSRKVTILSEYARSLFKLGWNPDDQNQALADAEIAARCEPSLQRRCELMCEVAEAFAVCGEVNRANALFSDIQTELPVSLTDNAFPDGFLWRKRGIKQRMLRAYCLAELVLGLGKASTRLNESLYREGRLMSEPIFQPKWGEDRTLNANQRARIKEIVAACENRNASVALRAASQISGGDSMITELRGSIYRDVASQFDWSEWALTYADDPDLQIHEPAIRGWALASAARNQWDQAWLFVRRISDPTVCAKTFCDLAEYSARVGGVYDVRRRTENLMSSQDKGRVLQRVGVALKERYRGSQSPNERSALAEVLFELVTPCAESFGATYQILARLVEISPRNWQAVAEILRSRGIIQANQK
jgi:hypothetical protein